MGLLNKQVLEKVKPTLTSLIQIFFGPNKNPKDAKEKEGEFFSDKFVKTGTNDLNSTPLTRKVWVNGQSFTLMGFSQQELNTKVEKIQQKQVKTQVSETSPLLYSSLYTEQVELQDDEWTRKRDVWVDEYYPA
jgi:hypothetical protein